MTNNNFFPSLMRFVTNVVSGVFVKFCSVGCINTLIDFGVFYLLDVVGLSVGIAQIGSWFVSVSFSYAANSMWTFRQEKLGFKKYIKFISGDLISFALSSAILFVAAMYMNVLYAKAASIIFRVFFSFFVYKHFVFKRTDSVAKIG